MDGASEFEPVRVYDNLVKMMGYRGVALIDEPLQTDIVVQKLNHYEFVTIAGNRGADDPRGEAMVMAVLIAPNSKYSGKSGDFKKLMKGFPKVQTIKKPLEVVIVSEHVLTIHIKKSMEVYQKENPGVRLADYDYEIFTIEVPKHKSVPRHEISTTEAEEFCRMHFTNKERFPKISQHDAPAVWLGLRQGMVAKIYRPSETAGYAIAWRYCDK